MVNTYAANDDIYYNRPPVGKPKVKRMKKNNDLDNNLYNYQEENINKNQGTTSSHRRALNSFDNSSNISRLLNNNNNNSIRNNKQSKSFFNIKNNKNKNKKKIKGSLEDYKRLVKKYYNIIIGLQDELTKQTIKNYNLLEENVNLKQKINDIRQNQ